MAAIRTISTEERASAGTTPAEARSPQSSAGFALVTVIIVLGALAFLVLSVTVAVRTTVRHATTSESALRASLAADSGIELGVELLLDAARRDQLRSIGGKQVECMTPDGSELRIEISDDAGRIDINIAKPELLIALLRGLGLEAEEAVRIGDAIADYRDSDDQRRPLGAERAEYRAAGRAGPANSAFSSVDEIALVLGISADLQRRLVPFLTVGSRLQGLDPRHTSHALKELVAGGADRELGGAARIRTTAERELNPAFRAASVHRSFTIRVSARVGSGALNVREASVEMIAARRPPGQPSEARRRARAEPAPAAMITRWAHGVRPADDDADRQRAAGERGGC